MARFNWLHLTDLHFGMHGAAPLWPNVKSAFYEDLAHLHEVCGPWQAILFTGDLVQSGHADEFNRLNEEVLCKLWERFRELGSNPVLLTVPGNHDLQRSASHRPVPPTIRLLSKWSENPEIHEEFWEEPNSEYRKAIDSAFSNYMAWWRECPYLRTLEIKQGCLPGDFSTTIESADGLKIGVVGLNTSFLQLTGGDYKGRLVWDARQFHDACGGDGTEWVHQHDACLLLTHQGPEWFTKSSRDGVYPEINPAGRFVVHLFGHMHEGVMRGQSSGGGLAKRLWQGRALFGLERYGDNSQDDRLHGYAAARLEFQKTRATLRFWPRKAVRDENGWRLVRDEENNVLLEDGGTPPEVLRGKPPPAPPELRTPTSPKRRGRADASERQRALTAYVEVTRQYCDIIDLAGLPEDDRHLAMQKFLLRQLYVPLRVSVEIPGEASPTEETFIALEQQRDQQRSWAAARSEPNETDWETETYPIGERLRLSSRLVVLGDPGSGKTTLLRWVATACLLRRAGDSDFQALPDVMTLPTREWLPVYIRCRELDLQQLRHCSLEDILRQMLRKLELSARQTDVLTESLRELLIRGGAILLIDGLDEITDPTLRAAFCEQIERVAHRYRSASIVITSRIVGYREMRYRLASGFEHCTLAPFSPADKDAFVRRWCEVTEKLPERRPIESEILIRSIHSSPRIERLTGNPMLLTTMALVQRKLGKLPHRRHKLCEEAVGVLLNWRSAVDPPLDTEEVLPQLQYVAYAMCERGLQRLRRDELLALLEGVRGDYQHIRPIQRTSPEDFVRRLEGRTSLIVEAGATRYDGQMVSVYEFCHLTFQEYLAGLAIVAGRFPGHDRASTVAQRVEPLVGRTVQSTTAGGNPELEIAENWLEALRMCVSCCNDDDVDALLRAIVRPARGEDASETARPRAILAALCLADEPNVSQSVADEVLLRFASEVGEYDGAGSVQTGIDRAAMELAASDWLASLQSALVREFVSRPPETRAPPGGLSGMLSRRAMPPDPRARERWMLDRVTAIEAGSQEEAVLSALAVMDAGFADRAIHVPGLFEALLNMVTQGHAAAHCASWALASLLEVRSEKEIWKPTSRELSRILDVLRDTSNDPEALRNLVTIAADVGLSNAVQPCVAFLDHPYQPLRQAAADTLAALGWEQRPSPARSMEVLSSKWVEFKLHGSEEARDFIIEHYRYLITKTRQRIIPSVPTKIAPEDLEQEGLIALVKAADQFDPSRSVKFESYAISMVRGAMLEYLRKEDWVPRSVRTKQKLIARAEEVLTLLKGEDLTDEDRAEYLELDIDQFYRLYFDAIEPQIVSLEDVAGEEDLEDADASVVLEALRPPDPDPYISAMVSERDQLLRRCVSWLPKPEQTVIKLYYYQGMTLTQIAKEIGRSESRVLQLHSQALMRLSGFLNRQRGLFLESQEARP